MKLTEADMTLPVLRLLAAAPGGTMPMAQIKSELEPVLTFSAEDLAPSIRVPQNPRGARLWGISRPIMPLGETSFTKDSWNISRRWKA
jgi:hypothetical protein